MVTLREILLVEDDDMALQAMRAALEPHFVVHVATDSASAESCLRRRCVDLVVLDLNLAGENGLEILKAWKKSFVDLDIVVCSGESKVERAIECLRRGASDYIVKPFMKDDALLILRRVLENRELRRTAENLRPLIQPQPVAFVGASPAFRDVREKAALMRGQDHINILILGESGTGKEVVARCLHQQENLATRPFVVVNTPAIPVSLMESELFGVEKGAYTDAKTSRAGKFELADGGDLFLDEIGDLPLETQPKILRALQEKQIERVGSQRARKVKFRVISATNRPLAELMAEGRFREDLMYRLSDMVLWLPPLRERIADLPQLAEHFIAKYARTSPPPKLSQRAFEHLLAYRWPGNVRQLESTIKRALIFNRGPVIEHVEIYDLNTFRPRESTRVNEPIIPYGQRIEEYERRLLADTIQKHGGNRVAARLELGLSRATFYRKLTGLMNTKLSLRAPGITGAKQSPVN